MDVKLAYHGHSRMQSQVLGGSTRRELVLEPNLARDPVSFDAPLRHPLRLREAISALHDVVVSDLRYKPRDKSAYQQWKRNEEQRVNQLRHEAYKQAKKEILDRRGDVPHDLEEQYNKALRRYWRVRQKYANWLLRNDRQLWRQLMPCDPVVTVSDEVVFFECFSADESSYGCLTVDREDGFGTVGDVRFGTTNVDYSWDLYHHFQQLRSYRETRFRVDPEGFEVATEGDADFREEKIELPPGWLRGFMQIQVAMGLPLRRVPLSREAVYSVLAWLKRNKARTSPRAIRFELLDQSSPRLVLEPWEKTVVSHGTTYLGPRSEPIRTWGRRRLLVLGRLLPLVERVDVYLLGTGMPSFWVARMGEMRLTVGLSGWTTNDWTRSSALDALAPPSRPSRDLISRIAKVVHQRQAVTFDEVRSASVADPAECAAALNHLALTGQVISDLDARKYRWRQVMPQALGEAEIGPENPEAVECRQLVARRQVQLETQQEIGALILHQAKVDGLQVEALLDADGMVRRGKCGCPHHQRFGIRTGPCRHILALRHRVLHGDSPSESSNVSWYNRLRSWSN